MLSDYLRDGFRFNEKRLAVQVDPLRQLSGELHELCRLAQDGGVHLFLVRNQPYSGELVEQTLMTLKAEAPNISVILVNASQEGGTTQADAMMLLNTFPSNKQKKAYAIEVIPTGYLFVEDEASESTAAEAASALQSLGYPLLYLDVGCTAKTPISFECIQDVRQATSLPLLVGGGINTPYQANAAARAGADIILVDATIVLEPARLAALCQAVHSALHLT